MIGISIGLSACYFSFSAWLPSFTSSPNRSALFQIKFFWHILTGWPSSLLRFFIVGKPKLFLWKRSVFSSWVVIWLATLVIFRSMNFCIFMRFHKRVGSRWFNIDSLALTCLWRQGRVSPFFAFSTQNLRHALPSYNPERTFRAQRQHIQYYFTASKPEPVIF